MRGNRIALQRDPVAERSIPAYAGEPAIAMNTALALKVYPRVCGGTAFPQSMHIAGDGLSPRMRGNPNWCP